MDIVKFKREQEQHRLHLQRVRNVTAVLDSSTPESLGLKHLAFRPKKQQLIEDRRQLVAKENEKLMKLMTGIMNEKRSQPVYVRPSSLNEVERKREVDRLNFENRLMLERLNKTPSVISVNKFEEDFKKHLKAESHLRRRQMKPLGLPKDFFHKVNTQSNTFDASTYVAQRQDYSTIGENNSNNPSPIKSMSEFRKHVISSKKMDASFNSSINTGSVSKLDSSVSGGQANYNHNNMAGNMQRTMNDVNVNRNQALYEMSYTPK